jgi:rRNA maturation protein Rpf1
MLKGKPTQLDTLCHTAQKQNCRVEMTLEMPCPGKKVKRHKYIEEENKRKERAVVPRLDLDLPQMESSRLE